MGENKQTSVLAALSTQSSDGACTFQQYQGLAVVNVALAGGLRRVISGPPLYAIQAHFLAPAMKCCYDMHCHKGQGMCEAKSSRSWEEMNGAGKASQTMSALSKSRSTRASGK
eukprot:scaffold127040_cov23-Tisochrysis_lutea.AAC.1